MPKEYLSPPGYNFSKPSVIRLPSELDEISGIAYYAKDNSLFAESDEKGALYKIFLNKPGDIRKWKFGHRMDFEDIVLHDSVFYILNGNGDIVSIHFLRDSLVANNHTFPKGNSNEFESLYFDDQLQKLMLLCKDCESDKSKTVSVYAFDPGQSSYTLAFSIDAAKVLQTLAPNSSKFKPSGASIHPVTGELYIISSINKLLVIADRKGIVKQIYRLNPAIFNHPEGIAFRSSGDMFISNEAGEGRPATVLFYQSEKNPTE